MALLCDANSFFKNVIRYSLPLAIMVLVRLQSNASPSISSPSITCGVDAIHISFTITAASFASVPP
jgi:hypothetical protein